MVAGDSVEWVPVESSVLAAVAYPRDEHLLFVEFRSGEIYCYFEVPPGRYEELLCADSKGGYFNRHIRNHFRHLQLGLYRMAS
jgi:hypothetical protein